MINELKTLSDAIEQAGISTQAWHSKYNPLKTTAPCFILSLSIDGNISNIRFLSKEKVIDSGIRTWLGGSNGETFPAFNFLPFYEYDPVWSKKAKPSEKTEAYNHFLNDFQNNDVSDNGTIRYADRKKANEKTKKCLTQIAKDFFQTVINDDTPSKDLDVLKRSLCNLLKEQDDGKDASEILNDKLLSFLREKQKAGKIDLNQDEIRFLLFNSKSDVVLFFDISEFTENYIASEALTKEINIRLLKANHSNDSHNCESLDAFGISTDKKKTLEKMPSVKLPGGIGNTILRSMNQESLCQIRYQTISSESYPVTDDIRKKIKQSLEWIADSEYEGITWEKAGDEELLFAYPQNLPNEKPRIPIARTLGNGLRSEKRFLEYAKDTIQQLSKLKNSELKNIEIELFAIKKADKARRKIVFYRNYSAAHLKEAIEEWEKGAMNLPNLSVRYWLQSNKDSSSSTPTSFSPETPFPLSVIKSIYTSWSMDGQAKCVPKCRSTILFDSLPTFDGLELFLNNSTQSGLACKLLSMLLQNGMSFLKGAASSCHRGEALSSGSISSYLEKILPILGILMFKLNQRKESYMSESPYLIGKMLNLADSLHKLYCEEVRDGNLPSELIGSSYFGLASNNPVQALSTLGLRLKPYYSWAKTLKSTKTALALWHVSELSKISDKLHKEDIPARLSDVDKAQLLLGYLSSLKSTEPSTENN